MVVTQTMVLPASPFPTASQLLNAHRGPNSVVHESAQTVPLLVYWSLDHKRACPSDVCCCNFSSILHCTVGAFPHCPFVVVGKCKILSAYTSTLLGIPLHSLTSPSLSCWLVPRSWRLVTPRRIAPSSTVPRSCLAWSSQWVRPLCTC